MDVFNILEDNNNFLKSVSKGNDEFYRRYSQGFDALRELEWNDARKIKPEVGQEIEIACEIYRFTRNSKETEFSHAEYHIGSINEDEEFYDTSDDYICDYDEIDWWNRIWG